MLEINLGEHKENSVATTTLTIDEPIEHTEVSCGCYQLVLRIIL